MIIYNYKYPQYMKFGINYYEYENELLYCY